MLSVRPDLLRFRILFVHQSDAFEGFAFDLKFVKLLLQGFYEAVAVDRISCALEIIDMR